MIVFIRLTFANTGDEVYYEGVCHYRHQLSSVLNVTPAIICRLSLDNTPLGLHCSWRARMLPEVPDGRLIGGYVLCL